MGCVMAQGMISCSVEQCDRITHGIPTRMCPLTEPAGMFGKILSQRSAPVEPELAPTPTETKLLLMVEQLQRDTAALQRDTTAVKAAQSSDTARILEQQQRMMEMLDLIRTQQHHASEGSVAVSTVPTPAVTVDMSPITTTTVGIASPFRALSSAGGVSAVPVTGLGDLLQSLSSDPAHVAAAEVAPVEVTVTAATFAIQCPLHRRSSRGFDNNATVAATALTHVLTNGSGDMAVPFTLALRSYNDKYMRLVRTLGEGEHVGADELQALCDVVYQLLSALESLATDPASFAYVLALLDLVNSTMLMVDFAGTRRCE